MAFSGSWVLLLLLLPSVLAGDSEVVVLTDENFDQLTSQGKWLVEFYAPWCGHCKKLAPIYDETSLLLKAENIPLTLGKMDCTVEKDVPRRFGIRGYPTLKYLRSGLETQYKEGRTVEALMRFARRVTSAAVNTVTTIDEINPQGVYFLLVGGTDIMKSTFKEVAETLSGGEIQFGEGPFDLAAQLGLSLQSSGQVIAISDADPLVYTGSFTKDELTKWILNNRFPLVIDLGPNNFQEAGQLGKLLVVVAIDPEDPKTEKVRKEVLEVAQTMREDFTFGVINGVEYETFTGRYGVKSLPDFVVLDVPTEIYYESEHKDFSKDVFKATLQNVKDGKVTGVNAGGIDGFIRNNLVLIVSVAVGVLVFIVISVAIIFTGDSSPQKSD